MNLSYPYDALSPFRPSAVQAVVHRRVEGLTEGQRRAARTVLLNSSFRPVGVLRPVMEGGPASLGQSAAVHDAMQAVRKGHDADCPAHLNVPIPVRGETQRYGRPAKRRLNKRFCVGANRIFKMAKAHGTAQSYRERNADQLLRRLSVRHRRLVRKSCAVEQIHEYLALRREAILRHGLKATIKQMEARHRAAWPQT